MHLYITCSCSTSVPALYDETIDGSYESGQVVITLVVAAGAAAAAAVAVVAVSATVEFDNIVS